MKYLILFLLLIPSICFSQLKRDSFVSIKCYFGMDYVKDTGTIEGFRNGFYQIKSDTTKGSVAYPVNNCLLVEGDE